MAKNDYGWKEPRCLLENTSSQNIQLNEETVRLLHKIHDPVVVVSVVGLYRTGKSYLLNKLAGKQSDTVLYIRTDDLIVTYVMDGCFPLGNTIQAKTKGIWIWCIPHPTKSETCLVLLDTEGLGDVEKGDLQNDVILFTLAALLSSTLVYNSKGTIDQSAMDSIHFVTEIAEKLKISDKTESSEDDDACLAEHFPSFIWAVRDFTLDLSIDGKSITADDYLENSLALKKGAGAKAAQYNLPRRCIRRYFPHRKCFTFPLPVSNPELMSNLEKLLETQLLPAFSDRTKEFCSFVFENSPAKAIGGHILNGPKFAGVAVQYVEQISKGSIPSIENAVVSMARRANEEALQECAKQYREAMATFKLPWENENLLELHHRQTEKTVSILFFKLAMILDDESEAASKFTQMIEHEYQGICAKNDEISKKNSEEALNGLQKDISTRINSGYYFKVGGYTEYQKDIAEMVRKYIAVPGKGTQSNVVLDGMLKQQITTAKSIMAVDKNMAEHQQKAEEQRLVQENMEKEMKVLKQAQEKAERRLQEQARTQKDFLTSMQTKFNQELETYKKQLNLLKAQLEKEQQKLRREGAREDADEVAEYFRLLQAKEMSKSPVFRFGF